MPNVSVGKIKQERVPGSLNGIVVGCCDFLLLRLPWKGISNVHVLHTAPQTRLKSSRIPSKDPHYRCPAQTRKDRPCIALYPFSQPSPETGSLATSPLYGQLRKCKHDSGEDVDDDLLVDAALYTTAEDGIAAYEARKKCVQRTLFPCRRCTTKKD